MADCEDCLRSLNTDYVDLFLIHHPDVETPFAESMRALNDLMAAGKTRYVGVSNFEAAQLRESRAYAPLITNQVGYNLFDRRWEYEMFSYGPRTGRGDHGVWPALARATHRDLQRRHELRGGRLAAGGEYERDRSYSRRRMLRPIWR